MTVTDDLLSNNRTYAEGAALAELGAPPAKRVAVVTCMDARIDPLAVLGLQVGEAHVMRNAGGAVTEDVIRSLAISQRKLGTEEVLVVQHTRCGMQTLSEDGFRAELLQDTGVTPPFAVESFDDVEANVRQSLRRIAHSPFLLHREARGFVFDVETGLLREVAGD